MRSRFSAFAVRDVSYLLHTWHPNTRPAALELDPDQQWYRLDILRTQAGGPLDTLGVVEFCAYYRSAQNRKLKDSMHETSRFIRQERQWFYVQALELQ